ncbi:hypothetical protein ONZ43_g447 [Nemania bipapillata]|uniref:Uncharacterized protein n=1 Tax=Nemania bipapillata TaxID=110536 RepID=A0ACC2J8C0_9PEZI|nr:hypothetical protein ONZ43_g447 [Nemania bipapillata]
MIAPPSYIVLAYRKLLPDWEDYKEFVPVTAKANRRLDLLKVFPVSKYNASHVPSGFPTQVAAAIMRISDRGIYFGGRLTCGELQDGKVPKIAISDLGLQASYDWRESKPEVFLELDVTVTLSLALSNDDYEEAEMTGLITYIYAEKKSHWHLSAYVSHLRARLLHSLFDADSQGPVTSLLEHIELSNLQMDYYYEPEKGVPSHFKVYGSLLLGPFELDVNFDHNGSWTFDASLKAQDEAKSEVKLTTASVGAIIRSIVPDADLPGFLADIGISSPALSLKIEKAKEDKNLLIFTVSCAIEGFGFTFVQYCKKGAEKSKRILKVSINKFPSIAIPMAGNITDLFGEMYYMYVDDASTSGGITLEEVRHINATLATNDILFKKTKSVTEETDVVVVKGSHFVIATTSDSTRNVVIDYVFNAVEKRQTLSQRSSSDYSSGDTIDIGDHVGDIRRDPQPQSKAIQKIESSDSSMAPFRKSIGPLSISNIGFKYADGEITLMLDAEIRLGPIGLAMLGAGITLNLHHLRLNSLPDHVELSVEGLAAEFNKPPVEIAGLFRKSGRSYRGGMIISMNAYTIEAAGYYGKILDRRGEELTSVFVSAKLEGPLVEFEFADISGVTDGFGYNSHLNFPSAADVMDFPFVSSSNLEDDPMETLKTLVGTDRWFYPENESYWLAAGLKVDSFQVLTVSAVAIDLEATFGLVELGIMVTVDFAEGVFRAESQLSPRSFILDKNCHPTGGSAPCYWFAPNLLQGDWVFTLGGYHRAYKAPTHYPRPPRLGIGWTVSDVLSITGEAYFAITPSTCMAGGRLHAALREGALYACFDAYADLLINFEPFHFVAETRVSVSVVYTQNLLFTSVPIKTEIVADLTLYGPPVAGRVSVNFLVFDFTVNFGPPDKEPDAVGLGKFYCLALQLKGSDAADILKQTNPTPLPKNQAHLFSCQRGLLPPEIDSKVTAKAKDAPWRVRSGRFCFSVQCRFPATSITLNNQAELTYDKTKMYAKPMRLTSDENLTSKVTIKIECSDKKSEEQLGWNTQRQVGKLPQALWGVYSATPDPRSLLNPKGEPCVSLMNGIKIASPDPHVSDDALAPFDVLACGAQDITGESQVFPPTIAEHAEWQPVIATGGYGEVAKLWTAHSREKSMVQKEAVSAWVKLFTESSLWDVSKEELTSWNPSMPRELCKDFENWYVGVPYLSRKLSAEVANS